MISLDNLTVSYGGWTLFDGISFLINEKDRIGLVGKNGAGKTTLLRIITGEQQPSEGAVTINGECSIGYLPQQMLSMKSASGCSYRTHMILAASIAEPPPRAMMVSGWKALIRAAPSVALARVGSGCTLKKVVC